MKTLFLTCGIIFTIFAALTFAQPLIDSTYSEPELIEQTATNINYPEPKHVLVVFRNDTSSISSLSDSIKSYYVNEREIPQDNILGLSLPTEKTYSGHVIRLVQNGEIIKDTTQAWADRPPYYAGPSIHAWYYFDDYLFTPIEYHLNTTIVGGDTLKNIIRYIVLCKGVPMKVQARYDWSGAFSQRWNMAADILLTYLCQPDPNFSILDLYGTSRTNHANPYRFVDQDYDFDYRFKSRHFPIQNTQLKLSYLVSRLDGLTKDKVLDLIDNSADPDYSGEATWVIDTREFFNYNTPYYGGFNYYHNIVLKPANTKLVQLGFNTNFDDLDTTFIVNNPSGDVMGYTSWGVHSYLPVGYILDTLNFNYANGAVFNTLESFNGHSMGINYSDRNIRRAGHGLISEFIYAGGSGGGGHTWEPYLSGAIYINYFYPAYAMGYSLVDAAYQGITTLGWQNIVIGDPLTAIAWGEQELTQNLTWSGTNLVTGEITIPTDIALTIEGGSYIELRHQGFIPCISTQGRLIIGESTEFEIYSWDKGLFLSHEGNPRLVWGEHPTFPDRVGYNIYRKWDDEDWNYLTETTEEEYTDETVTLSSPEGGVEGTVYYKVTAYSQSSESDYSNTVSADFLEATEDKILAEGSSQKAFTYSLSQNYPNPFNPVTTISYSLKKNGLVTLTMYDILGREVAYLVNENKPAGNYSVQFNASNLPSGIYFYKITSGKFTKTKKLILLK